MDLSQLRKQVQELDISLVQLLNQRAQIAQSIGEAKSNSIDMERKKSQIDYFVPSQEKSVIERISNINPGPLTKESIESIYREIISASISLQKQVVIGYLGPIGSFVYETAKTRFGTSLNYRPFNSIKEVFEAVETGTCSYGLVPFENSTSGIVEETIDQFEENKKVKVRAEVYSQTKVRLATHFQMETIKRVYGHSSHFKQVEEWLGKNLPNAEKVHVSSASKAAELASNEMYTGALCADTTAERYDLPTYPPAGGSIETINDTKVSYCRYFVLGRNIDETESKKDKTIVSFTLDHKQPGALCEILNNFKDINLTKIDTRPSPKKLTLFQYIFFIEMEGHCNNEKVRKAIGESSKLCTEIRVIGSYVSEKPADI